MDVNFRNCLLSVANVGGIQSRENKSQKLKLFIKTVVGSHALSLLPP